MAKCFRASVFSMRLAVSIERERGRGRGERELNYKYRAETLHLHETNAVVTIIYLEIRSSSVPRGATVKYNPKALCSR